MKSVLGQESWLTTIVGKEKTKLTEGFSPAARYVGVLYSEVVNWDSSESHSQTAPGVPRI